MKKKITLLISLLMFAGVTVFAFYYQQQKNYILNRISAEEAEELMKERSAEEPLGFSCLLCNGTRMPFDSAGRTFYVPVDMDVSDWETFAFMSGEPGYEILFFEDFLQEDKQALVKSGNGVPVLVYTAEAYEIFEIIFTGLPLIDLATNEGLGGETFTGNAMFYGTDFSDAGVKESLVDAHVRGNTSRMYPKKGYKLNLKQTLKSGATVKNMQSLFGMREDDDWILYAMYNDDSKVRDQLCIGLWQEMGAERPDKKADYNTAMTYVEVVIDNNYYGMYGLMEPVDGKQLHLSDDDYLYKRKHPHGMNAESFEAATDPLAEVQGFEIKEGLLNAYSWKPMAEFCEVLWLPDQEFTEEIPQWLDVDNAMRFWLFMQIITGHDQRAKNVYYAAKKTEDGYQFSFAPWDMDLTWGNVSVGEVNPLYTAFELDTYDDFISWETADRLISLNVNGAADRMQELYRQLREGSLSDKAIEEQVLEYDRMIRDSGAAKRDAERWPGSAKTVHNWKLIRYAKNRLQYLDTALEDLETYMD